MIKSYDLPNERKMTAEFDENGIGKITVQALDSLISELNEYAERKKCENCKILELLVDMEIPTICEDDYNDCEYCEQNCNFKAPTKECYLHWADMRKESEYHADPYHADFAWDIKTVIDNFRKESE